MAVTVRFHGRGWIRCTQCQLKHRGLHLSKDLVRGDLIPEVKPNPPTSTHFWLGNDHNSKAVIHASTHGCVSTKPSHRWSRHLSFRTPFTSMPAGYSESWNTSPLPFLILPSRTKQEVSNVESTLHSLVLCPTTTTIKPFLRV